ncbi:hypothetical protein BC332_33666 [Capsicum chinense]|nr:hypothetical protein BC332_33666 [Capsicum chinense]
MGDASVLSFSSVESNTQPLNEPLLDADTTSFGFLGEMPQSFGFSDLTADFTNSSATCLPLRNFPIGSNTFRTIAFVYAAGCSSGLGYIWILCMELDHETLNRRYNNFEEDIPEEDDIEVQELGETPTPTSPVTEIPKDDEEFAEAYKSFHVGEKLANELATPCDKSKSHPAALSTKKNCIGMKQMFKKHNQGMYVGALFIVVVMIMFNGMAEINLTILKLSDFFKQRDLLFYTSLAFSLPTWIPRTPITFFECAMWTFLTYYVMGFDLDISRLFKQFFLLVLVHQIASGLYRFIGDGSR